MPRIRRWLLTVIFFIFLVLSLSNIRSLLNSNTPIPLPPQKHGVPRHWWKQREIQNPVQSMIPLPGGQASVPKIQHDFGPDDSHSKEIRERRLRAVKESFIHSWDGYKDNAWMHDEVAPVDGGARDSFNGWGATLVDTLDTLWIMGLKEEFEEAVSAVRWIDFSSSDTAEVSVFETTIRYLGGFLAAYDLTKGKYPVLLQKAVEVGDLLYVAFDTPNRMPALRYFWRDAMNGEPQKASNTVVLAEFGSLSMEFTRLSQITKDPKYFDAVQRITNLLQEQQDKTKLPGMWPRSVDILTPLFTVDRQFSFGAMADSLYEYLPKEYLMLGGRLSQYKDMYVNAIEVAKKHIFYRPKTAQGDDILLSGDAFVGGKTVVNLESSMEHLRCFVGGMVALGAKAFNRPDDVEIGRKLTEGCIWAYRSMPTGIMPERFDLVPCNEGTDCKWSATDWFPSFKAENTPDELERKAQEQGLIPGFKRISHRTYLLRPEAIESVFCLYRITGDKSLQDKGWDMFMAIQNYTKTDIAHGGISDVTSTEPDILNRMESFWTAETLKYFYLLFSEPDLVSLDKYVFNTEAHPFLRT